MIIMIILTLMTRIYLSLYLYIYIYIYVCAILCYTIPYHTIPIYTMSGVNTNGVIATFTFYDMQCCLPSSVRIGCDPRFWFLRLGLGCIQNDIISQQCQGMYYICSNPANDLTFAATPLVLTPFVRNQSSNHELKVG